MAVEDDWGQSSEDHGVINVHDAFFATINFTGDHDWFQVSLVAGQSYLFTMRGLDTGDGTLADPFLKLRDAGGNVVKADLDSGIGLNSELIFVAQTTGTYFLDAFSGNSGTGLYTVGMEEQTDPPGDDTTPITLDTFFSARPDLIESADDKDWYRVELDGKTKYVFDLVGLGYRGSLPDGKLSLYRDNGDGTQTLITTDDNTGFGKDARIVYTTPNDGAGTYYLQAESGDGHTGFYWMYVAPAAGPNYMDALLPVHDMWWPPTDTDAHGDAHWTITYNFMAFQPTYAYGDDTVGFAALDFAHQTAVESALNTWAELTNITFVRVSDTDETAQLRFGSNHGGAGGDAVAAYANYPDQDPEDLYGSDVYFNNQDSSFNSIAPGQYGYLTMIHEIGHALGLKHPGNYNAGGPPSAGIGPFLPLADDSRLNTVMSYTQDPNTTFEPTTPMLYDIDAIQYLYGINRLPEGAGGHAGNSVYTFSNSSEQLFSIWDPSGKDTFNCSNQTQRVIIDLREFHMSSIGPKNAGGLAVDNVGIANGSIIEKAVGGSGADLITGNQAKNTLTGNAGDDTLDGGAKGDLLRGGDGKDTFVWDAADDSVTGAVQGGTGGDTLLLKGAGKTMDFTLPGVHDDAFSSIENIDVRGTGNNVLTISGMDVFGMNTGHQVIVKADAGDDCNLVGGGWSLGAADMVGYDHYVHSSGASLYWATAGDNPIVS